MAGITSTGLMSGLDIESLVAGLTQAEGAPQSNRILRQEATTKSQISALGTLKAVFSGLKNALTSLSDGAAFGARSAKSSDEKLFTASAGAKAVAGSYEIEVLKKATTHKLASNAVATADTAVGSGKLSISVGSKSFSVTLDNDHKSLANVRDAINAAPDNKGVTATLIKTDAGTRLVLTANDTGTANAIKVAASGGDGGLSVLDFDPNGTKNLSELTEVFDASIKVDGYPTTNSSNKITDAIDGVTIDLVAAEIGKKSTLTVTRDDGVARKAIDGFVTAYNTAIAAMATVTKYDATAKTAAALNGDAMVRNAQQGLRNIIGGDVGGLSEVMNSLAEIGITSQKDGTLAVDGAKLDKALAANGPTVKSLFGAKDGLAKKLTGLVDNLIGDAGTLTARNESLNKKTADLANQRAALETRLASVESRYRAQFTALETMMAKMSSTSSYLSQQLERL